MRSFGNLIINEWLKFTKKRSFLIPYLFMAALSAGFALILNYGSNQKQFTLDFVHDVMSKSGFGQIMLYVIIMATAGIMAKEHSMGTVKFLLIRAQSRTKILASKYVTTIMYMLSLILFTLAFTYLSSLIIFGNNSSSGTIDWSNIMESTAYMTAYIFTFTTLTFMIGVLTKSTGATIGIGLLSDVLSQIVIMLLTKYAFLKYLIFANTDLSIYSGGKKGIHDMTMSFSLTIMAVYLVIFLVISFVTFKKRDVA